MIKGVIDAIREMPGYAGMAVYLAHDCFYLDALDGTLADGMHDLFLSSRAKALTAIVRSYSILAFSVGDLVVVARFEGRYFQVPKISPDEDDIVPDGHAPRLMSKVEARREAQELLRSFHILPTA
ncbi:MAG TPA: hypothetical protein VGK13_07335 [Methanocellaceae archaeon]